MRSFSHKPTTGDTHAGEVTLTTSVSHSRDLCGFVTMEDRAEVIIWVDCSNPCDKILWFRCFVNPLIIEMVV